MHEIGMVWRIFFFCRVSEPNEFSEIFRIVLALISDDYFESFSLPQ